jgi:hypothetical protein
MSQTTSNASVAIISDMCEDKLLGAYKVLHGALLQHIVDNKLPAPTFNQDFAKCGPEDYKNIHIMAKGCLGAKVGDREAKRVAPLVSGLVNLRDTYNQRQRAEKSEYDAIPAQHRKFLAPFPTTFTIPASEVAKVWPTNTPASTIARDLMSEALRKAVSYNLTKDGSLSFAFVAEPVKVETKTDKAA